MMLYKSDIIIIIEKLLLELGFVDYTPKYIQNPKWRKYIHEKNVFIIFLSVNTYPMIIKVEHSCRLLDLSNFRLSENGNVYCTKYNKTYPDVIAFISSRINTATILATNIIKDGFKEIENDYKIIKRKEKIKNI